MQKADAEGEMVLPNQSINPHGENNLIAYKSTKAVCLFGFLPRLDKLSYHRYLIDLCNEEPSLAFLDRLLDHYANGKAMPDTATFNFKKGLH
jgi:hypothetical protein